MINTELTPDKCMLTKTTSYDGQSLHSQIFSEESDHFCVLGTVDT